MDNINKENCEWQLSQLFKLEAELALFTKQVVPAWNENLVKDGHPIIACSEESPLSQKYADLWFESWQGSEAIVRNHAGDDHDVMNWRLDKRAALRQNLCDYAKTELPAIRESIGENAYYDAVHKADELWCESWKACMALVSLD